MTVIEAGRMIDGVNCLQQSSGSSSCHNHLPWIASPTSWSSFFFNHEVYLDFSSSCSSCSICFRAKQISTLFSISTSSSTALFDLIHYNL